MREIVGLAASPGIIIGNVFHYKASPTVIEKIITEDIEGEISRFKMAIEKAKEKLQLLREKAGTQLGQEQGEVFAAHLLVLDDPVLMSAIRTKIEDGVNAEFAVREVAAIYIKMFEELSNEYMKGRATDIRDVTERLIRELVHGKEEELSSLQQEVILVAEDLSPSLTIQLDRQWIKGIILYKGSVTSHAAILARAMGIPAIVGVKNASTEIKNEVIIMDGTSGKVLLEPSEDVLQMYHQKIVQMNERQLNVYKDMPTYTKDRQQIKVFGNIGSIEDAERVRESGGEGIGLFRTEFLYVNRESAPSEEEQFHFYKRILELFGEKPVVIRTIDIGGDKNVPYLNLELEENPFLGKRAIRLCLSSQETFRTQLRALLRASNFGHLKIMFPMICTMEELQQAKAVLLEEKEKLLDEGIMVGKIEVGMMVETPAAALHAEVFAKAVDFFSIGTNDLVQYTFAADRMNEHVSYLYQPYHPVILKQIQLVVAAAHKHNKWVGICGEMASDPLALPLMVGLQIDEISVHAGFIPEAKYLLHELSGEEWKAHINHLLSLASSEEVKGYLSSRILC